MMKLSLYEQAKAASSASGYLATATAEMKNTALIAIAEAVEANSTSILDANAEDLENAKRDGMDFHIRDRMTLNGNRVQDMADAARSISKLEDPIGEVLEQRNLPNGLHLERVRVPIGVIGVIYESRPNVTIDIATPVSYTHLTLPTIYSV